VAEAGEFAVDAAVAPGRVLVGEAQDESADLVRGRWASWSSRAMGPVFGYVALVSSEEGVGCDDPACSVWVGSMAMRRYRIRCMDHQGRSTFALVNAHARIFDPHGAVATAALNSSRYPRFTATGNGGLQRKSSA
jgi:hypothetical protein